MCYCVDCVFLLFTRFLVVYNCIHYILNDYTWFIITVVNLICCNCLALCIVVMFSVMLLVNVC